MGHIERIQNPHAPLSEPEREMCFKNIRCTIENSDIDQKFKNVALYDLEQARVSYESRAFKACIVMFGAIIEGLMLGVIRGDKHPHLIAMIRNSKRSAPKVARNTRSKQSSSRAGKTC